MVRDAFASPKVALVRSQLVGAALVSKNKLPSHLEGCSLVVPVRGLEDVLILCLNLAPLSTRGRAARYPFSCAI